MANVMFVNGVVLCPAERPAIDYQLVFTHSEQTWLPSQDPNFPQDPSIVVVPNVQGNPHVAVAAFCCEQTMGIKHDCGEPVIWSSDGTAAVGLVSGVCNLGSLPEPSVTVGLLVGAGLVVVARRMRRRRG